MKKLNLFKKLIIALFITTFLTVPSTTFAADINNSQENQITSVSVGQYYDNVSIAQPITAQELVSMVNSKKTFVVYFGFAACSYCREFSPTLFKFYLSNPQVPIFYLDMSQVRDEEATPEFIKVLKEVIKFQGTPTVGLIKRGKVIHEYIGSDISLYQLMTLTKYKY